MAEVEFRTGFGCQRYMPYALLFLVFLRVTNVHFVLYNYTLLSRLLNVYIGHGYVRRPFDAGCHDDTGAYLR